MGGWRECDNRNSIIKACQSPGSPYLDNQVFTMVFASCPDIPASVDTGQCTESFSNFQPHFHIVYLIMF